MHERKGISLKKIIVRMPNWIGDVVMATPVLEAIKEKYPDASITAMCKSPIIDILKNSPYIQNFFSFDSPSSIFQKMQNQKIVKKLHAEKYDLGILLTNSFSSAWWFWQADIKHRLGYESSNRSFLLTRKLQFPEKKETQHLVETYKQLLTPLEITNSRAKPKLFLLDKEKELAKEALTRLGINERHIVIGINPGAAYGSAKCWLPERFRDLALRLLNVNEEVRVIFFGDAAGSHLVKQICQGLPARVVNLAGLTTLRELMAFLASCDALLTNDSGPMHIADALNVPLLALFGSTNPLATGPYNQRNILQKKVPCSPCYKRVCPIDFPCMKNIQSEEVFDRLLKLVKKKIYVQASFL